MAKKEVPEFIRRMKNPNAPVIANPDGTVSTHKMAWGEDEKGFYAFPTIVSLNGKLRELSLREAESYAQQTGELKRFSNRKGAEDYAAGSWKKESLMAKKKEKGFAELLTEYPASFGHAGVSQAVENEPELARFIKEKKKPKGKRKKSVMKAYQRLARRIYRGGSMRAKRAVARAQAEYMAGTK